MPRVCSVVLLFLTVAVMAAAHAPDQSGRWVQGGDTASEWPEPWSEPRPEAAPPPLIGGVGWYVLTVSLPEAGDWVIDFRHSSIIGSFEHRIHDAEGREIAVLEGGLESAAIGDFMMRHGRRVSLPAGDYLIVTRTESPFYLAQLEPAVFPLESYRQQYPRTVAFVLIGLGIFVALAFYYLVLGLWRRSASDLLYVGFIGGNILFNGAAQMVPVTLGLDVHIYLVSYPILVSNLFYVLFVMTLLGIRRRRHPRIWAIGAGVSAVLVLFWPVALIWPNMALELCRIGVGLMAVYGMIAGIARARLGDRIGGLYLVANLSFLVPAMVAISARQLGSSELWLIEHVGLLAVLLEVLLLALVMSYQISLMRINQDRMQHRADHDPLTGCLNRRSLESRLEDVLHQLPQSGEHLALLFIDLDGFKPINDDYGHRLGDNLLGILADRVKSRVRGSDLVARIGGDEFVVVLHPLQEHEDALHVAEKIREAIGEPVRLSNQDFLCTASIGLALYGQHGHDRNSLTDAADKAMYEAKARGRNRVVVAEAVMHRQMPLLSDG